MRIAVVTTAVCLSLVGLSKADEVRASIRMPTNIPAQNLGSALKSFAEARKLQVLYFSDAVRDVRTVGAVGQLTADETLSQLLSGTGLTFRYVSDKAIAILPVNMSTSEGAGSAMPGSSTPESGVGQTSQNNAGKVLFESFLVAQTNPGQAAASPSTVEQPGGPAQQGPVLQEVIVTARKREERLIDVPMSIVAVSGAELQQRQITSLQDLPSAVPGFSYITSGNNTFYQIRGVSNTTGSGSLVGVYIDEADATLGGLSVTQVNPVTYDVERVEVLRGPQGTLYGEGSAGGTIRFITNNPNLSGFAFDSEVAALFTENGGPSQRINAMVNVPLIENQLGLRMATTFEHNGGWIDLAGTDQARINAQDLTNVRVKGLWQPSSQLTVSAMAIINRDTGSTDYSDTDTPNQWTQIFDLPAAPRLRNNYDLYNLTLTYDFSSVRILNTTTYISVSNDVWNQGFAIPLSAPDSGGLPPIGVYVPFLDVSDHLSTDELRLTSTGSGRWQWTIGGFYQHYRDESSPTNSYADLLFPGTPLPAPTPRDGFDSLYKSWSAFGDTSFQLWDRFTLGAGIRYFHQSQDVIDLPAITPAVPPAPVTATFESTDPRVYAQLKLAPDVNIYASAAKGFRSGGGGGGGQPTYAPESVWTYELGTKMAFQEGRVGLDAAVFLSNYDNYQVTGITPNSNLSSYITNAGKARIKGIEANLSWQPVPEWRLDIRGTYLDTKFLEVNTIPDPITGLPSSPYAVGDPLDYVPRYQFTTSAQHDFHWLGRPGFIRLDYSQTGPETWRNRSVGPFYYDQSDIIHLLNFRGSLRLNDNLSLGISAQNLLNDQGFVNPNDINHNGVRSRPRTYGVDFSTSFH
jgi:outer membrane receptor protein involved in Fe transport